MAHSYLGLRYRHLWGAIIQHAVTIRFIGHHQTFIDDFFFSQRCFGYYEGYRVL
jgi:hypothetical protein